ncbi:hypothetical protein HBHAL_2954 [Halobacillus halophilus DSM 2266]|uniref:Uncharacterized protein n=1 Tax=Halobacillus halophilus (strain ATCC 35676 / DSM 2266 / JCM 20832 / KCTC 3685 / LMG 17431 / NBRC 102448 / NCIMB 2269) TaxID=866895 RepID=I0JMD2_HALH3|nr:hypothetical protein HBHAL_2954 [Halobacillus halophilus DSM 2266]
MSLFFIVRGIYAGRFIYYGTGGWEKKDAVY